MDRLTLGVLGTSSKKNELRLAIHPEHFKNIDEDLRERMVLERGYGLRFGVSDEHLSSYVGAISSKEEIFASADIILQPKPILADLQSMRTGQVLWGWPHAVQDAELTQVAIDKGLTLIAWEAMNHWNSDGEFQMHVFARNNELAGYCSVLHALILRGSTGHYGQRLRAVVIGFGSTARGAVTALQSLGISEVIVLTSRVVTAVADPMSGMVLERMERSTGDSGRTVVRSMTGTVDTHEVLAGFDVVVNCVLQDPNNPMMFVTHEDLPQFTPGTLLVDVSCDEGMGFEFARPTSFTDPTFTVGDGVTYYGVDHSPTYLWNSATWDISEALIPHLRSVMSGDWDANPTIARAIEIRDGVVQNPSILSFQDRSRQHPHPRLAEGNHH
ncbi:N(5)-(carboxyethyl)ornithine synthase [Tessaracoccus antarcticus]|uniref:Alanine dehydrogenase n=1 Tax=Tessaracoccus antarcticus TaxID=2479848 RepID=A0A3M0G1W3_9ACTN|nr:N(5)-(carboxyethyl)ornithine synthase [Tessaracoccus antarcticus]RMB58961.1 alanine dehydrogenase [Tessaracoccus antarcticus]